MRLPSQLTFLYVAALAACGDNVYEVRGVVDLAYVSSDDLRLAPFDLDGFTIKAFDLEGDSDPAIGSGSSAGHFEVLDLPARTILLQIGDHFRICESGTLNVQYPVAGSPDSLQTTDERSTIALHLTGLSPWETSDTLQVFSEDAATQYFSKPVPEPELGTMGLGGNTISAFEDLRSASLVQMSKGHRAWIFQMRREITELGNTLAVVAYGDLDAEQREGQVVAAVGSLQLPTTSTATIAFNVPSFYSSIAPYLQEKDTVQPFAQIVANASIGGFAPPPKAFLYRVVPAFLTNMVQISAALPDSLNPEWIAHEYGVAFYREVAKEGVVFGYLEGGVEVGFRPSSSAVPPLINIPLVRVDGQSATAQVTASQAPYVEVSSATSEVIVEILQLVHGEVDGFGHLDSRASFFLDDVHGFRVPPEVVVVGQSYILRATSIQRGQYGSLARATFVSGLITVVE